MGNSYDYSTPYHFPQTQPRHFSNFTSSSRTPSSSTYGRLVSSNSSDSSTPSRPPHTSDRRGLHDRGDLGERERLETENKLLMEQLQAIAKAKMMDASRPPFNSDRQGPHDSGDLGERERLEMEDMEQLETVTKGEMMNTSSRPPYTSDSGPSRREEAPADRRSSNSPNVRRLDPLNPGNPGILKKGSRFTFKKT